ncbi:hypothetical protein M2272_000775 [Mycobacterium frederiksbergense]|uniref:Winged helix DNA-binding domain-containing protein n=1 Tax=Mycolicibacterium frederiksbergense TaxID=117567 RepID=A0ABT6KTW3_9MYCO|nr:hypothetical protein [Mycolicibacterium frederiksbergense]MDH6194154.1 hypothetical protein [Mycolicibacterium frederiksbergense]
MGAAESTYEVAERAGHLEVRGVSRRDVEDALELISKVRVLQADHVAATRADLLRALMARNVTLTPPAALAQAQRLATHRDALLATPVFTHDTLRAFRGDAKVSSTRAWLTRRRDNHEVFTVTHSGRTLIPAFQLDELGQPRPELQPVLEALVGAGITGWPLWTWLTSSTSLLSGAVPEQLASSAPDRVLRAAQRFAATLAA